MPRLSWRCQILFLLIYNILWPVSPVDCNNVVSRRSLRVVSLGSLRVEPPVPFLMGSNLTLYCDIDGCRQQSHLYLEIDEAELLLPWKFVNCTAIFTLTNFRKPKSDVLCMKRDSGIHRVVNGITLYSGIPPDKAQSVSCETTRNASFVDCKWNKGKETHFQTVYNITITKENGSLAYSHEFQDKDNCLIRQKLFDENAKYQLIIAARNHFGQSRSDPLNFSLSDIVIPETPHVTQIDFDNKFVAASLKWKTSEFSENLKPRIRRQATNGNWEEGGVSDLGDGLVQVTGLKPLTDYEFQVKTCLEPVQQTHVNPPSFIKTVCSKWSPSFWTKTPGKGTNTFR